MSVTLPAPKFASKSANPADSKFAQPPSSGAVGPRTGVGSQLLPHGLLESTAIGATAPSLEILAAAQAVCKNKRLKSEVQSLYMLDSYYNVLQ
jgi:hypothetical protein